VTTRLKGRNTLAMLDHKPVPLQFGTSGLRGLVKDLTDLEAYINVKGALRYLLTKRAIVKGSVVVLAGDLRPSTDRILRAAMQAVVDLGCQVENAGKIPTPALIHYTRSTNRAGVMVTGSHIPFDRNGIKINQPSGELLKSDEQRILHEVKQVRAEEYARAASSSLFDASGMRKLGRTLPAVDTAAERAYIQRYTGSFARTGLHKQRIVVYQHSAVGRDVLTHILAELGADVVPAGRSDTFVALDTENISDEQLATLEALVVQAEANGRLVDAIVSTDGDSDRPLIAVVTSDETRPDRRSVRVIPGDLIGILVAEYLAADVAAVPISANDAVDRRMQQRGVSLSTTKIGSPYVVAALNELRQEGKYARIAGWEANGGFLCGSDFVRPEGTISALPTRDAVLPILAVLFAAAEKSITLSALWEQLPARFGRSGLLDDIPTAASAAIIPRWVRLSDLVQVEFTDADGVIGHGPEASSRAPVTPSDAGAWLGFRETLSSVFTPALGFDAIRKINLLDGLRISFRGGDVAHVRPSGNAPQLRMYANCDSQERANQIIALGIREPDGLLRQLIKAMEASPH
jgi:phosphomannomutase